MAVALREFSHISSYADADEVLDNGRDSLERTIGNNTIVHRPGTHTIRIRLHRTDVVEYVKADPNVTGHREAIILRTGGWRTVTTKDRINRYTPTWLRVYSDDGTWYIKTHKMCIAFEDGMKVYQDGTIKRP